MSWQAIFLRPSTDIPVWAYRLSWMADSQAPQIGTFKELVGYPRWRVGARRRDRGEAVRTPSQRDFFCDCKTRF